MNAPLQHRSAAPRLARVLGVLLALVPLVAVALVSRAAERTASPHGALKEDCGLCHGASAWKPARISPRFDHARFGFRLEGAHADADCRACHKSLDFKRGEANCVTCHEDVHRNELGADCARCHSSRSFIDRSRMVRAHSLTRFPLRGAHAGLDCEQCHAPAAEGQLQFVSARSNCMSCHMDDYRATTNPNHAAGNVSTDCQSCHSSAAWQPAHFSHAGITQPCESCHLPDYQATTQPVHSTSGYPTTCQTCHNTRAWVPATLANHDAQFFPIYSGAHRGRWSSCNECHTTSGNFANFNCLACHPHDDQAGTNSHHSGVNGYQYSSQACYSCHPRGRK
jgi:Zn finger protein HypA/HybF involved in hydrogenase expression